MKYKDHQPFSIIMIVVVWVVKFFIMGHSKLENISPQTKEGFQKMFVNHQENMQKGCDFLYSTLLIYIGTKL